MKKIKVFDLVGKNAISMQSGTKLHDAIAHELLSGGKVEIDFTGVSLFASPFFNASVGVLLKDLSIEELMDRMKIINCSEVGLGLLNTVIQNALNYYSGARQITDTLDKHGKE
ncbi:STAS-like domain-containing protein [Vibrio vulnificus]|uniref:STAS-like domain-containing protein n=1 Tax=Vibrio vulnificus TaxID=672 RepID=UPI000D4CC3D6|nr:STAS-like domain-containing protein [Vibrio vulnificus]EHD0100673.1 STAS-like domain-containing protein [Vibrio vulnificus]EHD2236922.1 STAS-like domain-containing protein [Vibrio vulnificus]EHH0849656.1 STAS-like domain-containing protein [Vibrio vulnificus]EHH2471783.1 STAS-like domain-containing protein [Vibrio vulnificus]EHZ2493627.1 STAS-like domain-containing protein [Vibrio vulnificus]